MKYLLGILLLAFASGCSSSDPIAAMDDADRSIEKNRTEVIGANRSLKVGGSSNTSIDVNDMHHVIKDKKQFINGSKRGRRRGLHFL